jgi:PadR family transcriptional regulator
MNKTQLLQGTLDLVILRILELGPNHGWGISNRLQQMSGDGLKTSQGSLYPALHRLEMRGEVKSEMTASDNNRRARVYTLTALGKRRLGQETETWEEFAASMRRILRASRA